ncbi:ead/Ea22-like family protein [Phytobacter sp. RSE-02]|uniref:ead/Ea22-like family protein n=1 Tax=Phytobacter sp. RSE-02 TaxID=3229229 RepID=UPI00339D88CE
MTSEHIQALKARYAEPEVPNCRICGEKMHITRAGGGSVVYGCDGRVEGDGYAFKEGRDFADKHYEQSRETVYNLGDPDVIALLAAHEADKALIAELSAHLRNAHAFIENTEAFGGEAATGIIKCGGAEWNIDASKAALANSPMLTVKLPKPHAHLIWIQAGHGPDDYWDEVAVSHSEKDRCCDGSERYPVYSIFEIQDACAAAGITLKVGGGRG